MSNELQNAWDLFLEKVKSSSKAKKFLKAIEESKASYADAQEYSSLLSGLLMQSVSQIYPTNSEDVLKALKDSTICKNYFGQIDNYTYSMQKTMNKANNMGLNAVKTSLKTQLVSDDVISTDNYKNDISRFTDLVELSGNKRVDTIQQANAKFQDKAGYSVTVSRKYDGRGLSDGRTCKWCLERAKNNVPYKQAISMGMFQRHEGCHCIIEYNNNGAKTYQFFNGGRDSWTSRQDWMSKHTEEINGRKISIHDSKEYANIKTQTNTTASQKVANDVNEIVNVQKQYGDIDEIVVVKNNVLGGIAGYDHTTNKLYLSEELGDAKTFRKIVDVKRFPAKNLEDVIEHELGGHKKHWDSIKQYSEEKGISADRAKENLENELRKYVDFQLAYDRHYIQNIVSENAHEQFFYDKELNELIADAKVRIKQGTLTDEKLKELVLEVTNYDGKHS